MDPVFARNRISAYLDGELPPGEAERVTQALASDGVLAEEHARLARVRALLQDDADDAAPAGFSARVSARIASEEAPSRSWRPAWLRMEWMLAAATAAGVLAVVVMRAPEAEVSPDAESLVGSGASAEARAVASAEAPPELGPPAPAADVPSLFASAPVDGAVAPELTALPEDRFAGKPPGTAPHLGAGRSTGAPASAQVSRPKGTPVPPRVVTGETSEREPYTLGWEATSSVVLQGALVDYRVDASRETALKELAQVANSLGGRLVDAGGKPFAPYPMDAGDARKVKVVLPPHNLAAFAERLAAVGAVSATPRADLDLTASDGPMTLMVEVVQP